MKRRFFILYLLLPLLMLFFLIASPVHAVNSSKKYSRSITSLQSVHKFHPGNTSYASGKNAYRDTIVNLSAPKGMKNRPGAKRKNRLPSEASLKRKITSRSAIIMDGESGRVIYSQAPDRQAQPASTIKILTGLIAIQRLEDSDWVPASRRAASMPRSKVYLRRGKSYRADDLINAVLLSSANDASVALAEKIAGSERVFSKLMTFKAKAWGAKKTVCKTATGLTARGQKSTVRDLAILFNRAMDNSEFADRVAKAKIKTGFGKVLHNHNRALWQIRGAEGGKTGFTNAARQTYVGQFKRGENQLTIAILGSETMWDDVKRLVEYGFGRIQAITSASENHDPVEKRSAMIHAPVIIDHKEPFLNPLNTIKPLKVSLL